MVERVRDLARRAGTVRVRTTAAAVVVVGLALAGGVAVVVTTVRTALTDDLRDATALRAAEVASAIERGEQPPLAVTEADEQFVQVLDGGRVVAASTNVEDAGPIVRPDPGESATLDSPLGDDDFVAVAAAADVGGRRLLVVFGQASDDVGDSTETVAGLLLIAAPVLLAMVGLTTWTVVGRALRPVDAMRREVEEISTAELHRRVPEPVAQDEVARLATTMNGMLARLQAGQDRQRRFVADASHELRSPLAAIRQHAEVARAHPDQVSVTGLADEVLVGSRRMQQLVDDLLLLARADEQSLALERRPVDLDDLVFDEARRLRTETSLRVDTHAVSAARVAGHARSLRRILSNLGDNAARHAAGVIALTLGTDGTWAVLTVEDDGPGIPSGERERVLDRFVRLDEGRARGAGGAGLGLSIVAELVAAHGGEVRVGSGALGGAQVEVRLPLTG